MLSIARIPLGIRLTAVLGGLLLLAPAAQAEQITHVQIDANTEVWVIHEPDIHVAYKEYPGIRFAHEDQLKIVPGGAAQHGGHGRTWKLYDNPRGPGSDQFYFGMIEIPGVTAGLVRLKEINGKELMVPKGVNAKDLYLRLGYKDNDYSDNGYWGRQGYSFWGLYSDQDNGVDNQCAGEPNAYVVITVKHKPGAVAVMTPNNTNASVSVPKAQPAATAR